MSEQINRETWSSKLLVEGIDDLAVIANLRNKHQLPDNFEIVDCKSVSKVPDKLISYINLRRPRIQSIGVIVDADARLQDRWNSLKSTLEKKDYIVPNTPESDGTVIKGIGRNPTIGVWLMPDNLQSGMLEDFIRHLIPQNDLLHPFVDQILTQIEAEDIPNRYDPAIHRAKAFIHTWLAWQKDPGKPMGTAIAATFLDHNTEVCLRFVDWLNRLFNA